MNGYGYNSAPAFDAPPSFTRSLISARERRGRSETAKAPKHGAHIQRKQFAPLELAIVEADIHFQRVEHEVSVLRLARIDERLDRQPPQCAIVAQQRGERDHCVSIDGQVRPLKVDSLESRMRRHGAKQACESQIGDAIVAPVEIELAQRRIRLVTCRNQRKG